MTRISLRPPRSVTYWPASWYSRRKYGVLLDPGAVLGHHPGVLRAQARYELAARRWDRAGRQLKDLAMMAAAIRIGCAWCIDFGQWELRTNGIPAEKIGAVAHWRDRNLFTDTERLTLEYAEAMTATPPEVTDELVARPRTGLTEAQLVELTAMIALENVRSRINAAFGLSGQGFADRRGVPTGGRHP